MCVLSVIFCYRLVKKLLQLEKLMCNRFYLYIASSGRKQPKGVLFTVKVIQFKNKQTVKLEFLRILFIGITKIY